MPSRRPQHDDAVAGVHQAHARGEQERKNHDRPEGHPLGGQGGVDPEPAICVAVSNPKPKRKPTKYICQLAPINLNKDAQGAGDQAGPAEHVVQGVFLGAVALPRRENAGGPPGK